MEPCSLQAVRACGAVVRRAVGRVAQYVRRERVVVAPVVTVEDVAAMSDDAILAAMFAAVEDGSDAAMARFALLADESDAREAAAVSVVSVTVPVVMSAGEAAERAVWAAVEALIDEGADPQEAEAMVRGVELETIKRRDVVLAHGWVGGWSRGSRLAFETVRQEAYLRAEDATRGAMLRPRSERAGVDPRDLFFGTERYARAHASEELLAHWDATGGRRSLEQWRHEIVWGTHATRDRFALAGRADYLR